MKKYYMGLKWINFQPILCLKDFDSGVEEFARIPKILQFSKMKSKICIGTTNPYTREHIDCNQIIGEDETQCVKCKYLFDFYKCVRCHGNECIAHNKEVIDYCNTPHYVYLVYFPNNKIKVGTASEKRKYERLVEQGAVYSIFIAKTPDGKIARQIEKNIIDMGINGSITTLYKMKNLVFELNENEIKNLLFKKYKECLNYIQKENLKYVIDPEFNYFDVIDNTVRNNILIEDNQISLFETNLYNCKQYSIFKDFNSVSGEFLFAKGNIIAIENKGNIELYDVKKLEGFLLNFENVEIFEPYLDKQRSR